MNYSEWLGQLKVGDEVYVSERHNIIKSKVLRLTPHRIVVQRMNFDGGIREQPFNRRNGFGIGSYSYNSPRLEMPDEKIRERCKLLAYRRKAENLIVQLHIQQIPLGIDDQRTFIKAAREFLNVVKGLKYITT